MNPINPYYPTAKSLPWDDSVPSGSRCGDCERCQASDRFEGLGWCPEIGELVKLDDEVGTGDEFECPHFADLRVVA